VEAKQIVITWEDGSTEIVAIPMLPYLFDKVISKDGYRLHKLSCDEYHAHTAPRCCAPECWCRKKAKSAEEPQP
jgi:hypothetical protein